MSDWEVVPQQESEWEVHQQPENIIQKLGNAAGKFNKAFESTGIPSLGGGFLQGVEHGAASVANLPLKGINKLTGSNLEIPYTDLGKYIPEDPMNRLMFGAGEIGGQAIPGAGAFGKLSQMLGKPKIAKDILAGAGAGFATGGEPDEDMTHRIESALVGGTIPGIVGFGNKTIAKKIIGQKEKLGEQFGNEYSKFFQNEGLGAKPVTIPETLEKLENSKAFKRLSSKKDFMSGYESYKENPTIENAHVAQSDLGKLIRKLKKDVSFSEMGGAKVPSGSGKAIRLAEDLRNGLKESMEKSLKSHGMDKHWEDYLNLSGRYRNEMTPYFHPSIAKFEKGKIRAGKLVKEISKDEKFMQPKGAYKDIPGLATKRILNTTALGEALHRGLLGGALGAGAAGAYQLGIPALGSLLHKLAD